MGKITIIFGINCSGKSLARTIIAGKVGSEIMSVSGANLYRECLGVDKEVQIGHLPKETRDLAFNAFLKSLESLAHSSHIILDAHMTTERGEITSFDPIAKYVREVIVLQVDPLKLLNRTRAWSNEYGKINVGRNYIVEKGLNFVRWYQNFELIAAMSFAHRHKIKCSKIDNSGTLENLEIQLQRPIDEFLSEVRPSGIETE